MGAIDIGIGHDDDTVITQLVRVELLTPDSASKRGDQGTDFLRGEHLVKARLLDIEDFSTQREDRLVLAVPALLGRSTCRITLYEIEFGEFGVLLLAVRKFSRKTRDIENALAARHLACFPGCFACPRSIDHLAGNRFGVAGIFEQKIGELFRNQCFDNPLDLG